MRFSVLAVELSSEKNQSSRELLHDIAEFAARENVSSILLSTPPASNGGPDAAPWRSKTYARSVQQELAEIGLRYESVHSARLESEIGASGSAILTQLSLLSVISPSDSIDAPVSGLSGARLAVSPRSVIDVFAVPFSTGAPDRADFPAIVSLVELSDEILDRQGAQKPRRRGPIRRGPKVTEEPVRTRFICVAVPSSFAADERTEVFSASNLTPITEVVSGAPMIFVRPAIKPLAATTVTLALRGEMPAQGSFVSFDL